MSQKTTRWAWFGAGGLVLLGVTGAVVSSADQGTPADARNEYTAAVQPLVRKYCLDCHSTKAKKGSLDLERFASLDHVRKDLEAVAADDRDAGSRRDAAQEQAAADARTSASS